MRLIRFRPKPTAGGGGAAAPDISAVAYGANVGSSYNGAAWAAIDAVNLTLTLTLTKPAIVVVMLSGSIAFSSAGGQISGGFDFSIDGGRVGDSVNGLRTINNPNGQDIPTTIMYAAALAAGAHTILPMWAITFGSGRVYLDSPGRPTLFAMALGG